MPNFPAYAEILFAGYSESFDPSVLRTDMERGVPKQRLLNTQVLVKVQASILFRSAADVEAFEDWYFNDLQRIGWFDMAHPRTDQPIKARFENGSIGALVPLNTLFRVARRDLVLEYLR